MGKDNFTETVNFLNLREKSGLTLAQLAALSGYSSAAINGLELNNAGSHRLREKLKAILTENVNLCEIPAPEILEPDHKIQEVPDRLDLALERIAAALERIATAVELQNPPKK